MCPLVHAGPLSSPPSRPPPPTPTPARQATQWQVVALLLLKALSLERCPSLRPAFETRDGIARLNQLLGRLAFTGEEYYAALELLCPVG